MEENIVIKNDATDRISELPECIIESISELPECIIESILLRLDKPKDRVRVSVLSKKWFALIASLPMLNFNSYDFAHEDFWISGRGVRVRENFYKYLNHTVSRFCRQQNVKNAHTFRLLTVVADKKELDIIDKCVKLILMRGVKVLNICIRKYQRESKYRAMYLLPDIISSVSTLTSLIISDGVMLPLSLTVNVVSFKSLKELWLHEIALDPSVIKHLTTSCPLLEVLVVNSCYGLKKFCVNGRLQNLKTLRFIDYNDEGVENIDIEAPNLRECFLAVCEGRGATSVILSSCTQLRTLCLDGPFFSTSIRFSEFLSNFPFLENLSLCLVNRHNSLTVSSPSLRNLWLHDECDLEEIEINIRNLHIFKYVNAYICDHNGFSVESYSGELKTCMECHIIYEVDTLWLLNLRRYLEKANRYKILKLINLHKELSVDFELSKGTQLPPYELEHVELKMPIRDMLPVLEGLLWCFRPRSLSLTSHFSKMSDEEQSHFLKFISEKLIQQEDQGSTSIRIEWFIPYKDQFALYLNQSDIFTSLPTVTFKKEYQSRKWCKKYQRRRFKQVQESLG